MKTAKLAAIATALFFATQISAAPGDIIIPIADMDSTAKFYSTQIDGIKIEVLALKASDGTIRTAFNTCQVCYDSGRGYYRQSGAVLICQNCGNRFRLDQVEKVKGGCNPVPIDAKNKKVDSKNIVISREFLAKHKELFRNWRR
jgi:uncharacterized membrane protein